MMFDSTLRTGIITPFENPMDPEVYDRIRRSSPSRSGNSKSFLSTICESSRADFGAIFDLHFRIEKSSDEIQSLSFFKRAWSRLLNIESATKRALAPECSRIWWAFSDVKSGRIGVATPLKAMIEKNMVAQFAELRA